MSRELIQILSTIVFFVVFIQLFVALSIYLFVMLRNYLRESKQQRALSRSISSTDIAGLVATTPNATIVINELGIILYANSHARDLFGYPDLIGMIVEMLLPEHLRELHQRHRKRYFADPKVRPMGAHLNLFGLHANGTTFPIEVSLSPLTIDEKKHAVAIIVKRQEREQD